MENQYETVQVQLLGGFKLSYGGLSMDDQANRSLKIWSVLSYMIVHRDRSIPQKELLEKIWVKDEEKNLPGAMKTLLFRVRKALEPVFGEETEVILSRKGFYFWNPEIKCILDSEQFEQWTADAEDEHLSDAERMAVYAKALSLYKGDFLPKLREHLWTAVYSAKLRVLYLQAVKNYAALLYRNKQYAEMEVICQAALRLEELDEKLYLFLLQALLAQGKHIVARGHYESAIDIFHRKLGIQPSKEMREMYREIVKYQKEVESDLGIIIDDINAKSESNGAFVCDFGFFQEAYRLTARQATRDGICIHIVLLTLTSADGEPLSLDVLNGAMTRLSEVMTSRLRRGDVITRYSGAQYLLLLPRSNYEDSFTVIDRILSAYGRCRCARRVKATVKIQEVKYEGTM